jgi:hypothetical protein
LEIELEKLISLVTAEVMKELKKQGVQVLASSEKRAQLDQMYGLRTKSEEIDMSKYKTPILTENHIRKLHELTGEVVIPKGTIVTPKAKEIIKEKRISIVFKS